MNNDQSLEDVLYVYNKTSNIASNEFIKEVDISSSLGERNLNQIHLYLKKYIDKSGALIIDRNFLRGSDLIEFIAYVRLSHEDEWDIPIFIFTKKDLESLKSLFKSDHIGILKTDRIDFIDENDFEKDALSTDYIIKQKINISYSTVLNWSDFINKIEIKTNEDKHSIANEWAIYQWAKIIGCDETEELTKIFQNVQTNLYFKYLRAINPISERDGISSEELTIKYSGNPRVLLIDDEVDKGWYEIFAYLLGDINNIYTDYLGVDFKKLSNNEIIEKSIKKIKSDNIDVVILDFRLHPSDFENKNIKDITSIKLLEEIKKINPGIQVIIFSATNKVWNLQALQNAGADGFILKNTGKNVHQSIKQIKEQFEISIKKADTLKKIVNKKTTIEVLSKKFNKEFNLFDLFVANNLKISFDLLNLSFNQEKYLNYAYLQLFICIEEFLKLDCIFKYGDKCYADKNIKVFEKSNSDENKGTSILKYVKKEGNKPSYYIYLGNDNAETDKFLMRDINTDYKMSCVIIFLFNQEDSNNFNWPEIRDTRNKKAAHPEASEVNWEDVFKIFDFLIKIFDRTKFEESPKPGLKDDISKKDLEMLREKFKN